MAPRATNTRNDSAQQPKSVKVWFPVYVGDFFTVTSEMTGHEVGAYQLIIAKLWREGGAIPANDKQIAKLVKASPRQWKEIKETLWPLFEIKGGMLTHAGTLEEIEKAKALSAKNSDNARRKWAKHRDASAEQAQCDRIAKTMPRAGEGEGEGALSKDRRLGGSATLESDGPFVIVTEGRHD